MSQNTFLLIFAIINVIVIGIFASTILRQYVQRRREAQLYWSLALLMALGATLAYIFLVTGTPTSDMGKFFFRLYYVLGAALTPAWLGLGSVALVTGKRTARTCLFILCLVSLLAVVTISEAPMNLTALAQVAGTPGTGILQPAAWLPTLIVLNTAGVVAIVGVALYSGWQLLRRHAQVAGVRTRNLLWANVLILSGALCDAAAGTLARLVGLSSGFWLIMALGWSIFYVGVLMTGQRKRRLDQAAQATQPRPVHNPLASV